MINLSAEKNPQIDLQLKNPRLLTDGS